MSIVLANFANYGSSMRNINRNVALFSELSRSFDQSKKIFFLYGFSKKSHFGLMQYLSVCSALSSQPEAKIFIFYIYEPSGEYWNTLPVEVERIQIFDFDFFGIAHLKHFAHKADIIRLLLLLNVGGLYLDIDTISMRRLDELFDSKPVMGIQLIPENGEIRGLCNAVMSSPKDSAFIKIWLKNYRTFKSGGHGLSWDEHSVRLPWKISQRHPQLIKILAPSELFQILWFDLESTILSNPQISKWNPSNGPPVIHLWESLCEKELSVISENYIKGSSSFYAKRAREVLDSLGAAI